MENIIGGTIMITLGLWFAIKHKTYGRKMKKSYAEVFNISFYTEKVLGYLFLIAGILFSIVGILTLLKIID
jgi:hypothetical protein